jgi:hypothetical protein
MASGRVPQEMWDRIIGFVCDQPTLQACSTTCRAWLDASQRRLFAQIPCVRYDRDPVAQLQSILATSPRVGSHIAEVSVESFRLRDLSRLRLPSLRILSIHGPDLPRSFRSDEFHSQFDPVLREPHTLPAILSSFPRLTSIRLVDIEVSEQVLQALPPRLTLELYDTWWRQTDVTSISSTEVVSDSVRLKRLSIRHHELSKILDYLIALSVRGWVVLDLERVTLAHKPSERPGLAVNPLLQLCKQLRSFELTQAISHQSTSHIMHTHHHDH